MFTGGHYLGWKLLTGNYSTAEVADTFYLSDPFAVLQMLFSGFLCSSGLIIGAATILAIYAITGGRVFCSWVCPMNMVTDLANFIRSKLKLSPVSRLIIPRNTRYYILILSLLISPLLGFAAFEAINPIGILYRGIIFSFGFGWVVISALMLFEISLLENGWCGHLCPVGAFYSVIGRFGFLRIWHTKDKCTNCMNCFKICPEKQVLSTVTVTDGYIKSGDCNKCGRCVEVCDDKALNFSINYLKNKK